jgi:hypothetical protein
MILKSYILQELFPFQIDNRVHVKFNENNTYLFPHNLFKILISFKQLVKFIFGIKSSSVYKVQISTNYEKIMLKFIVLYIAFCYTWYFVIPGIILLVLREITHIKTYYFRIRFWMGNRSIDCMYLRYIRERVCWQEIIIFTKIICKNNHRESFKKGRQFVKRIGE